MPSKQRYAFARATTLVVDQTGRWSVRAGDVWYADHPFVQVHADLFSDEPVEVKPRGWVPPVEPEPVEPEPVVEQATKAPGEKRNTRRAD
jgi:hypothetical protein